MQCRACHCEKWLPTKLTMRTHPGRGQHQETGGDYGDDEDGEREDVEDNERRSREANGAHAGPLKALAEARNVLHVP
jgi:hypothetical protein